VEASGGHRDNSECCIARSVSLTESVTLLSPVLVDRFPICHYCLPLLSVPSLAVWRAVLFFFFKSFYLFYADRAIKRPGRLEEFVRIPSPDLQQVW
jgi:hypothetical protein